FSRDWSSDVCSSDLSLLTRPVENHVDDRLAGLRVVNFENLRGNFDEIGVEPAFVPLGKNRRELFRAHSETVAQHTINFGDHLHEIGRASCRDREYSS